MKRQWLTIRVAGFLLLAAVFLAASGLAELVTAVRSAVRSARTEVALVTADMRRDIVRLAREDPGRSLAEIAAHPDLAATMQDALARAPSVLHVGVLSPEGVALAYTQEHSVGALIPTHPPLPDAAGTREALRILRSFTDAPPTYQSETDLLSDGRPYGTIRVVVAGAFLWDGIKSRAAREFATAAVILGLAILSVVLLERIITGRIRILEAGVAALRKGEFDSSLPEHGIGEFGRLAEELNRLGEQVRRERESGSAPIAGIDESRTIAELGRMAAGAAHQLGNRLQGVHMDLRSLQHAERLSSEEVRDRAKEAVSALESLDRVVRGFLKMARIRPLAPEMVPLDDLLREVHRQLRQEAALAGIEIVIGPSSPEAVAFVDPEVVRQAMTNVIRNSIQAIGDRGGRIALAAAAEGDEVRLSIADDGPGMPPEVVERAFELYFTTRGDGHGIGLPLVRQAVERHGGRALLRSDVGKGTEVTLVFPRPGAPRRRAAPDVTSSR